MDYGQVMGDSNELPHDLFAAKEKGSYNMNEDKKVFINVRENAEKIQEFFDNQGKFAELMMYYRCAIREVTTKFEVLNDEFSTRYQRNPIEYITSRIKKPGSIIEKLGRKGLAMEYDSLQELNDIAGVRVICSFIDDIYHVAGLISRQDDIRILEIKDYIKNPKPNGYRSYHMIVEVPVFFSDSTKMMRVEVQIRTIAMDFWSSLEHELKYKKEVEDSEAIIQELKLCADKIRETDEQMLQIRRRIFKEEQEQL